LKITGGHFVQEDSPDEIGAAIIAWLQNIRKCMSLASELIAPILHRT